MAAEVEFGQVEGVLDAEFNEDGFIVVEVLECVIHVVQGLARMHWVLHKIDKIKEAVDGSYKFGGGVAIWQLDINDETEQKARNLVVLLAGNT
jgi:hypothetical protein